MSHSIFHLLGLILHVEGKDSTWYIIFIQVL